MSTYYYMACEDCKERTSTMIAVKRLAGCHIDSPKHLFNFLYDHELHHLRFFSEHDDERYKYKEFLKDANDQD